MKLRQRLAAVVASSMMFTSIPVFANVEVSNTMNAVSNVQSRASGLSDAEREAIESLSNGKFGDASERYKEIREKLSNLGATADFEDYAAIKLEIEDTTADLSPMERIALTRRLQASYAQFVYSKYTGVTTDKKTGNSVKLIKEKVGGTSNYTYKLGFYDESGTELGQTDTLITRSSSSATFAIIPNLSDENIIVAQAVQGIHVYNVKENKVTSLTLDTGLATPSLITYNSDIIQALMNATVSAKENVATTYRIYNKTVGGKKEYYLERIEINLNTGEIDTERIATTSTQVTSNYTQNQVYIDGIGVYLHGLVHEWALPETKVSNSEKECIMSFGQSKVIYALGGISGTTNTRTITEIYNGTAGSTNTLDKYIREAIEAAYPTKYDRDNTKITDLMEIMSNAPTEDTQNPVIHGTVVTPNEWTNTGVNITVAASDNKVLHDSAYSFDGGKSWQASNKSPLITENGTISIVVRDAAENLSNAVEVNVDKIDKNAPIIKSVTTDPTSFPSNESIAIIEIDAEDDKSGIKEYSFDGGVTWQTGSRKAFTKSTDVTIKVKDNAGNITTYGSTINVDIKELTGITINGGDKVVMVGETISVDHTLITKATPGVTWEIQDASLAKIDANGKLTGLAVGETLLTAKVEGMNIGQTVNLKVIPLSRLITDFDITEDDLSVKLGERIAIPKIIAPSNATNQKITWVSSDPSTAMVINDEVVGLKEGYVVITGTTADGSNLSDAVVVSVVGAGEKITAFDIVEEAVKVEQGKIANLQLDFTPSSATNKEIKWISSDPSVAMVVNNQVVGLKPGIAVIVGVTMDGSNLIDAVVVTVPDTEVKVTSFEILEDTMEVNLGQQLPLTTTIAPSNATNTKINWTSSDSSIAMVINNKVIGLKAGIAVITGTTADGSDLSDAVVVMVADKKKIITSFELVEDFIEVKEGESKAVNKKITPNDATNQQINWVSLNPDIAIIKNDEVIGLKDGIANITGTTTDGSDLSATLVVNVKSDKRVVKSISVLGVTTEYAVNESFDLKGSVVVTYEDGSQETLPIRYSMITHFNTSQLGTSMVEVTYQGKSIEYEIEIKEKVKQQVDIMATVPDKWAKQVYISVEASGDVDYVITPTGGRMYSTEFEYVATSNGQYVFTVVSKDGTVIKSTSVEVKTVDIVPPTVLVSYKSGWFYKDTYIKAVDNESGPDYIIQPDGTNFYEVENELKVKQGDQCIYVAVDKADNRTIKDFNVTRAVINNLDPTSDTITTIVLEGVPSSWTNQDVTIQVAANNDIEGVNQVTIVEGATSAIKENITTDTTTSSAVTARNYVADSAANARTSNTDFVIQNITVEGNTPITYTIQTPSGYAVQTISVDKIDKVAPIVKVKTVDNKVIVMAQDDLSGIKAITLSNGKSYTASKDEILSVTEVFDIEGSGTFEAIVEDYAGNITVCKFGVNYDPSNPNAGNIGGDDFIADNDEPSGGGDLSGDNDDSVGDGDLSGDNDDSVGGDSSDDNNDSVEDDSSNDNNDSAGGDSADDNDDSVEDDSFENNNGSTGGSTNTGTSSGGNSSKKPVTNSTIGAFKPINIHKSEMKVTELLNEYVPFTLPAGSFDGKTIFDNRVDSLLMDIKSGIDTVGFEYQKNAYSSIVEGISQGSEARIFKDVSKGQWWYETITNSVKAGYLKGQTDISYGPKSTLTYADALAAINRALVLNGMHDMNLSRTTVESYMSQFNKAHWAYYGLANIMSKMSEEKVAKLTADGEKVLATDMTRGELAEILYELLKDKGLPEVKSPVSYEDCEATNAISFCTNTSLMIGVTESTFAPNETLTRAQLATVIDRIAKILTNK